MTDLLTAALELADLGYSIFPCMPGEKRPATRNGFLSATNDAAQIEAWWSANPRYNIGLATQGLLVVDIDVDGAGNPNTWLADDTDKLASLNVAPLSITPRGGKHYFFRQPLAGLFGNTASKLAPNVDTRADGGYVVVAPSILTGDRRYKWAEGMRLECPTLQLPEPPDWLSRALSVVTFARRDDASKTPAVGSFVPSGARNATLTKIAGFWRHYAASPSELNALLQQANKDRCNPPLPESEVENIAKSVGKYPADADTAQSIEAIAEAEAEHEEISKSKPKDPGPFPQRLLKVPGFIGELMEYNLANCIRPQPELALAAHLTLLGTLCGRKVCDADYNTRTNLINIGLCAAGGGKEFARKVNKRLLRAAGLELMNGPENVASASGQVKIVAERPSLLMMLDEFGKFLNAISDPRASPHQAQIVTEWMRIFTSSDDVYNGAAYADTSKNLTIVQPNLSLYGTTVADSFWRALTVENLSDGFMARVFVFEASNPKPRRVKRPSGYVAPPMPKHLVDIARYWGDYRPPGSGNLYNEFPQPLVVPYSDEAAELMDAFADRMEEREGDADDSISSLWGRAHEKARKLALLYACSANHESPEVTADAVRWATELAEYITARLVYQADRYVTDGVFDAKRQRVLRIIQAAGPGGLSQSLLYNRTRNLQNKEREDVLTALETTGDVVRETVTTGTRPKTVYRARR